MRLPNTAATQRHHLLASLKSAGPDGVTTIFAREELDVMSPAPRVLELRAMGWDIRTIWTTTENAQGHKHRNARYVFMGKQSKVAANG